MHQNIHIRYIICMEVCDFKVVYESILICGEFMPILFYHISPQIARKKVGQMPDPDLR